MILLDLYFMFNKRKHLGFGLETNKGQFKAALLSIYRLSLFLRDQYANMKLNIYVTSSRPRNSRKNSIDVFSYVFYLPIKIITWYILSIRLVDKFNRL
jgi:hypothetical protein